MAKKIDKLKAGAPVNSVKDTINQLVDAVNALQEIELSPKTLGTVKYSDGNVVITFNTEKCP